MKIVWSKHNLVISSSVGSGHPGKYAYEIPHKYSVGSGHPGKYAYEIPHKYSVGSGHPGKCAYEIPHKYLKKVREPLEENNFS